MPRKFFLLKGFLGHNSGVYTAKELAKFPKSAHKNILPLSVAVAQNLVVPDYNSGENLYELDLYPPEPEEGAKLALLRGVNENTLSQKKLLLNKLRQAVQKKRGRTRKKT